MTQIAIEINWHNPSSKVSDSQCQGHMNSGIKLRQIEAPLCSSERLVSLELCETRFGHTYPEIVNCDN